MASPMSKKRKLAEAPGSKRTRGSKKLRKQTYYSSPSPSPSSAGEDFVPVSLGDSDIDDSPYLAHERSSSDSNIKSDSKKSLEDDERPSNNDDPPRQKTRKAGDPAAFSNSIAKILGSKLSTSKRADPVLARSATAQEANESLLNSRLEAKARQKLSEDRKKDLERGRVKEVLLGRDGSAPNDGGEAGQELSVGEMQEQEKRLRKTAQRGVVKLFNAVRAAQVKGEEAARNSKSSGRERRQERVGEMSKQGFLDLVSGGGGDSRFSGSMNAAKSG